MDPFNPFTEETYVKPLAWWQIATGAVLFTLVSGASVWALTVLLFSLER